MGGFQLVYPQVRIPIDERLENIERKQKKLEIKLNKSLKGPTKLEMKEVMDQITVDRTKYDELLEELELLKQKLRDKEEEIERLQLDQAEEKSRLTQEIQMLRDELEAKTMTLEKLETDVGCLIAREKRMSKEIANIQQNLQKLLFNNNNKDSPRRPVVKKYRGRLQDWKP
ncbi:uncharacterized protein LOC131931939 [Physella acuta]|uniref:uncharacterized protein LOC131931939 n=1 Tax=Physella acuta TaxID=109671 RepID=UPI0027DDC92E|nr:uncharacterized protein LOC131931939 [Physella acuta]